MVDLQYYKVLSNYVSCDNVAISDFFKFWYFWETAKTPQDLYNGAAAVFSTFPNLVHENY